MDRNGGDSKGEPEYLSYLLRLWRVTVAGQVVWRGSLECAHTGERLGFADSDSLWRFLRSQMLCPGGAPCHRPDEGERPASEEGR